MKHKQIVYSKKPLRMKRILSCWQLYLFLLPAVAYVFIFNYMPMYGVQIAFKNFRSSMGIWDSPWVGLKYFRTFVNYPYFSRIVWNTLSINLYSLIVGFPAPIILAIFVNEIQKNSFKKSVQLVTYAPHFISTVVVCGMILLFLNENRGIINKLLEVVGIPSINFLSNPQWFSTVYVLSGVWQNVGWGAIIYLAALSGVDPEQTEAALIDGASRIGIIRHIKIPHIFPTIVILLILRSGQLLSLGFEKVFLLQNPLNLEASEIISTYVYKVGLLNSEFSYSAAIGLFNNVINLILLASVNLLARRFSETSLW